MGGPTQRRIDAGDGLAALGAVLVLIALFLPWFGEADGWEAFESLDLVLGALALTALGAAAAGAGLVHEPSPRSILPIGIALVVIVALQLIEPPPGFGEADADRGEGAWLALAGASLVFAAGLLRITRLSISVTVAGRDARARVPAVDRREEAVRVGGPPAASGDTGATQQFAPVEDP